MENKSALAPAEMHVSASGGRRGLPLSGSIAVLALSALLAAPAAGQTPLVDIPASADGPVHLSMAGVNRGSDFGARDLLLVSSSSAPTNSVPQVMGRGFRLLGVSFRGNTGTNPNRWRAIGRPSIPVTDLNELAVVVVGPPGTTPRVLRLSEQESSYTAIGSTAYIGPVVAWAAQALSDVNTHTSSLWTFLVVDHTIPGVDLNALTYTPPPPPPTPTPPPPTPPLPQLTIDAPQVVEGPSGTTATLRFTAKLSRTTRRTVTVAYEDARQGTARAGALCARGTDYVAFAPGTLTFAPGTRTQTIDVTVIGDAVEESDETVRVRLHSPVNADLWRSAANPALSAGVGVGTIVDDDPSARSWFLPLVVADSNPVETGFVRIVNRSDCAGVVAIHAIDDAGRRAGPVSLSLDANAAAQLNSRDLEEGNASKGLSGGVGSGGAGPWRLELGTELDVEALAYVRTAEGFVTSVHESVAEGEAGSMRYRVPFFNPGSNRVQQSRLRLVNPWDGAAAVVITGRDDAGEPSGGEVRLTLAAGESRSLGAEALEEGGDGLDGSLGDGSGKWRLTVSADRPLRVMSLLRNPAGNLTNVSGAGPEPEGGSPDPEGDPPPARTWILPLVVADADPVRTGLVRILNRSDRAGAVAIHAIDDAGRRAGPVSLSLDANAAVTFNSWDLERGNASKGLSGGVGSGGAGPWRLELRTALDVEALAYIRTAEGFVTSVHGSAAEEDVEEEAGSMRHSYRVPFFNPGSNRRQQSRLRLVNLGDGAAEVVITGRDDAGETPGSEVRLTLAAGESRSLGAEALEEGGDGLDGSLGDGSGKWRLTVSADRPLRVMSLLRNPTGSLTNVSGAGPEPEVESRP